MQYVLEYRKRLIQRKEKDAKACPQKIEIKTNNTDCQQNTEN